MAIWVAIREVELKAMEMGSTRFCYLSKASGAGTSLETKLAATMETPIEGIRKTQQQGLQITL